MGTYTEENSKFFDKWVSEGWEWGTPISHEQFERAKDGELKVLLTPTKFVPEDWFGSLKGKKVLGLASGGGQQMPIFTALGADCTVFDYSQAQLASEKMVAERENYEIEIVRGDMSKPLPFDDDRFDLIFHPVSNSFVEDVLPIWKECFRILKKGGRLLSGLDNGITYAFDDDMKNLIYKLPFNPLKNEELYQKSVENDWGIQFSHTIEEQIGGQLKAGLVLKDVYQDIDGYGAFHDYNIPTFFATYSIKP